MEDDIYSDDNDVSSRLDDIENKIDCLDAHHSFGSGRGWVMAIWAQKDPMSRYRYCIERILKN